MAGNILNLDEAVKLEAFRLFEKYASKKDMKLLEKEKRAREKNQGGSYLGMTVDWSEVQFIDRTRWLELGPQEEGSPRQARGAPQTSVLFKTKFRNDTAADQNYKMTTQKVTKSTCAIDIESCFTKGIEMGVTLKSPCEIFEANVGFHAEMSLTNRHGQTFEEEMQWGVESDIVVAKGHEAEASLVVEEVKQRGDFVVDSMIWGTVKVYFTKVRDNNTQIQATSLNIANVVEDYIAKQRKEGNPMNYVKVTKEVMEDMDKAKEGENGEVKEEKKKYKEKRVFVQTRGSCKFRYGVRQEIQLNQTQFREFP